jgi:ABC-2 type transport system permease protein
MNSIFIVARKEALQILHNRQTLLSAVLIAVIFGGVTIPAMLASGPGPSVPGIAGQTLGVYVVLLVGVFLGYLFAGQAFLREKQEGTIETLLCSPLSLRQIWLGKVLGVTAPAYGITIAVATMIIAGTGILSGAPVVPDAPVLGYILLVVPVVIAAAVGLLGFVQLLLGMRENQIINMVVIFGLVFSIGIAQELAGPSFSVTWTVVGVLFAGSIALLLGTSFLSRFLDRERIVLTLP